VVAVAALAVAHDTVLVVEDLLAELAASELREAMPEQLLTALVVAVAAVVADHLEASAEMVRAASLKSAITHRLDIWINKPIRLSTHTRE
jgi:hypothetical protein